MLFGLFWGDWTVLVLFPAMIFATSGRVSQRFENTTL